MRLEHEPGRWPVKTRSRRHFPVKYGAGHAEAYYHKHRRGLWRRLSHWRESAMAASALRLAGEPAVVLDLPAGTGRFWGLLASSRPGRVIYAADSSEEMLRVAMQRRAREVTRQVTGFRCSAFAIPCADNAVDAVFSMRLLHHIGDSADRMALFREFGRVASGTVCVSLWVDGNLQARRRRRLETKRAPGKDPNRFVVSRQQVEREFRQAGLEVIARVDLLRFWSMWRVYVLRVPPA